MNVEEMKATEVHYSRVAIYYLRSNDLQSDMIRRWIIDFEDRNMIVDAQCMIIEVMSSDFEVHTYSSDNMEWFNERNVMIVCSPNI